MKGRLKMSKADELKIPIPDSVYFSKYSNFLKDEKMCAAMEQQDAFLKRITKKPRRRKKRK